MAELFNGIDQHIHSQARPDRYIKALNSSPGYDSCENTAARWDQSAIGRTLGEFRPLPREALFLGIANDGLPVLLNLFDPSAGPILLVGDPGAGKTLFLQQIAWAVDVMHTPQEVQYGILTAEPEGWQRFAHRPTCIGVFDIFHQETRNFLNSLHAWSNANRSGKQAVLVLLDGLEMMGVAQPHAGKPLYWLLTHGPAGKVWPIVTLDAGLLPEVQPDWLDAFQTHIFGRTTHGCACLGYQEETQCLTALQARGSYLLREEKHWLEFRALDPGWG